MPARTFRLSTDGLARSLNPGKDEPILLKPQLETVQAHLANPAYGGLPLHSRIQRAIRKLIIDGALTAGRALPASRALAQSLGVSRDTVEAAYAQLHAEGFITRRVGSGSFVSQGTDFRPARPKPRKTGEQLSRPAIGRRGMSILKSGGWGALPPRPFAPGIPETRMFPLAKWERLQRQVLKEYGTRALFHGDPQGAEPLRRVIADYVNLERGGRASANQVLVLTSSQQAMWLCATVLFDQGDRILVEDPIYGGAAKAFAAAGLDCVSVRLDHDGMVTEDLCTRTLGAKGVFVTPSHQYPTGATLSLDRRLALIDWAVRKNGWIVEDDYDSEFHYVGRPTACIQGLDPHERTIYAGTFTKSLFPSLRLGYLVLPTELVRPMVVARSLLDGHTAVVAQLTLARFIEGGHFGAHIRQMREVYRERLDVLLTALRSRLAGFVEPLPPSGGLQVSCLLSGDVSERASIDAARHAGIELRSLTDLHTKVKPNPGWLMGFAAYPPQEIKASVKRLAHAMRDLRRA